MIAYLEGKVLFLGPESLTVLVSGIGYEIRIARFQAEIGENVKLFIFDLIREDRHELYGFSSLQEKAFFEDLIDVSGVGAKMAQKVMRVGTVEMILQKLADKDLAFFQSIPGIGKKLAQKIILELQGTLVDGKHVSDEDSETVDALVHLGYAKKDCLAILPELKGTTPEERIREALQRLSR
ncbi:MAG: Holliday junction branch migration protein RuvA [Patescibacteria group bacterium]